MNDDLFYQSILLAVITNPYYTHYLTEGTDA